MIIDCGRAPYLSEENDINGIAQSKAWCVKPIRISSRLSALLV